MSGKKGTKQSPEWIAKRTAGLKGRDITWRDKLSIAATGKKLPEETKRKMSEAHIGKNNHQFGKPLTQEHRNKISKTRVEKKLAAGKNNPAYVDGRSFFPYCDKFDIHRKRATRDFFDNLCICCGAHKDENFVKGRPENLSVHHIDHDKEQGCSGKPFNLVPLCRECHQKEGNNQEEYRLYINNTLREGFKWGIWSESEYQRRVMY